MLAATWLTNERAVARLCPADGSRALFDLAAGHAVTPIEAAGGWVRIAADGREGWIPSAALARAGAGVD
jgi:SH3-like domain-containing protein